MNRKNSMGTSESFQFRNEQFSARSRKTRVCAEAYRGTSHKQPRSLTPRLWKRAIYGWKLNRFGEVLRHAVFKGVQGRSRTEHTCWAHLNLSHLRLYDLYWNAKQMKAFNGLLGRDEFSFWHWLFLSALTCGIFHLYYEYRMGIGLVEIQEKYGMRVDKNLPLISLLLSIFGFSIVVDAIQQYEINKLYEKHRL